VEGSGAQRMDPRFIQEEDVLLPQKSNAVLGWLLNKSHLEWRLFLILLIVMVTVWLMWKPRGAIAYAADTSHRPRDVYHSSTRKLQ
jgi:hypothetical protein